MIESFFILAAACAAAYLAWFFLPKIPDSGGRMFSTEEYAWLAVGLFFLPVLIFFGVLTGYFFLFWRSNPAALNFLWWLLVAVPMTLIPGLVVGYSVRRIRRVRKMPA
jgi:hypothetical protein